MAADPEIAALAQPKESTGPQGITLAKWKRLADAFRAQGPNINYREAARVADVKPVTAKHNYEKGTERLRRPAIRDLLLREQVEARAAAQAETTKADERIEALGGSDLETRAAANKQAVTTKAQESRLLAGTRVTAEVCLAVAGKLLKSAAPITERLAAEIARELNPAPSVDANGKPNSKAPADLGRAHQMMRMLFDYARDAAGLARSVVDLERVLVGSPGAAAGITTEVTAAEAAQELVAAARMLKRFADDQMDPVMHDELVRAGANLRVIQGGKAAVG